jgi:ATP-dependent helicase/nuclease subunit A
MTESKGAKKVQAGGKGLSRPADQAARERICRDLDRTFLVEAGAGSGKTRSLVDRMIALIAAGRTTIQGLAAVTFTRKAAAELRGRFQLALERSLGPDGRGFGPGEKARLRAALRDLEQGFIGTIHSFSARIIRERPVECGIDPEFEEMEDLDDALFREACWHDYLIEAGLKAEEVLRDLEGVGLSPGDLREAFETISVYPEVEPAPGRPEPPDFEGIGLKLEAFLDAAAAEIPDERPEAGRDELQSLMRRLAGRRLRLGFKDHRLLMESLELMGRNPRVVKKCWPTKAAADSSEKAFDDFRRDVAAPALRAWREFRHDKALTFLRPAERFYEARRREKSKLNFQDQLLLAAGLLRDNPEVRRYFKDRYARILVDEFQDTDPIQAEILFYLTGADEKERDWTKIGPEPGRLFLVGDPRQSIYRFRRADIDIYNLVKRRVEAGGGEVLSLTANFRSLACVADWVNPVFAGTFPATADAYQAGFAPLEAARESCREAAQGVFKISIPKVERNKEKDIAGLDAARIARFIAWACAGHLAVEERGRGARPARPEDFLILFRYRKNMDVYARALAERGVPHETSGSAAFSESEEILEIIRLLLALKDPDDPVAAAAALKGIFFGVSDQELLDFSASGGKFAFAGDIAAGEGSAAKVRRSLLTLREWWGWTKRFAPSNVLEMILEASGLLNYLIASGGNGRDRAGNVLKLVEAVRALEIKGASSFAGVAGFVADWVGLDAFGEMNLTPGRRDVVRLMNLHKAKGLEAPVVILANPAGLKEHEPDKHIVRLEGKSRGLQPSARPDRPGPRGHFLFSKTAGWKRTRISEPAGWEETAEEEKKYAAAEEDRLMYVAATRAGDILVVSTYEGDLGAKKAWRLLDGRLAEVPELAWPPPGEEEAEEKQRLRPRKLALKPGEAAKGREEILLRRGTASRAGYLHESVTSLARQETESPEWPAGGFGLRWGTAVHIMLSVLGKGWKKGLAGKGGSGISDETLLLIARNATETSRLAAGEEENLTALVREIVASEFWTRAMAAERAFFEIPFSVKVEPGDPDYRDLAGRAGLVSVAGKRPVAPVPKAPLFLTGAIDLAFFEDDGWVIADYKTDTLGEAAREAGVEEAKKALDALVDHYRPQVSLYGRFWEKITGDRVKESGLYFTSIGTWARLGSSNRP